MRSLLPLFLGASLCIPAVALAEDRDEAIFGGDAPDAASFGNDSRDEEIFGGDSRDEDIFGSADPDEDAMFGGEAPPDQPPSNEEEVFGEDERGLGGGLLGSAELDRRLGAAGSKMEIGGLLYLRGTYTAYENQPEETGPFSSPNLLDVYLDARPSDELRVFVRGRLTHQFAGRSVGPFGEQPLETNAAALDQLWLKWNIDHVLYVTAGRQPIKWGAGRFWNPTDFLNRTRRDPLAVFDERLGVGLIKLHLPIESSGWNLYAIADFEDAALAREVGTAFRVEKLFGDLEVSASTAFKRNQADRFGLDVSFPLWDFDLRGEVALVHGDRTTHFKGDFDDDDGLVAALGKISVDEDFEDRWYQQLVLGAEIDIKYSDRDSLTLGAEYFYNGAGYDDPRFYPALLARNALEPGVFSPLYLGRHYGGFYASAIGPGRWDDTTLIASLLSNFSDNSWLGRFDYRVRVLTYLDVNTHAAVHFGDRGEFRFGFEEDSANASELEQQLPEGVELPDQLRQFATRGLDAAIFEIGAGLSLRF